MNSIKIVKDIAQKLSDIRFVDKVLMEKNNYLNINNTRFYPRIPLSLSHGIPGLCLLYGELDKLYPNEGWHDIANGYIKIMVDSIERDGLESLSLFSGTAGIAFSIMANSCNGRHYTSLLKTLNNYLIEQLNVQLDYIDKKNYIEMFDYDVIQGMSGIANYLPLIYKDTDTYVKKILQYFINLSKHINYNNNKIPGWFIKKDNLFNDEQKNYYSNGALNLGLSHGIPGPLIILCKSYSNSIFIDGQIDAIKTIVNDIVKLKIKDCNTWNSMVKVEDYINGAYNLYDIRDAWCYGSPGLSYSLLLASITLKDDRLLELSCDAMKEAVKRRKGIFSPTFCHGYSGLAYISYKFYYKTKNKYFLNASDELLEKILSYYDSSAPFGFYDIEHSNDCDIKNLNSIAFLDGVVGTLLTILELTLKSNNVYWDTAFLLDN
ncbi:lanthionine synthetase C family protein [Clostridium felsineum]|uniref:lanthionine synthetase C family protein n=1 Tax=Clostridium felsineum TaxID=36839 RepID=UPI00214DEE3A|nr:lanthionine synthetase C family protein [Clostridium felsineum]MCR3758631.1 lanthionine synthetase C family protein [Clostridium felsineum]